MNHLISPSLTALWVEAFVKMEDGRRTESSICESSCLTPARDLESAATLYVLYSGSETVIDGSEALRSSGLPL